MHTLEGLPGCSMKERFVCYPCSSVAQEGSFKESGVRSGKSISML